MNRIAREIRIGDIIEAYHRGCKNGMYFLVMKYSISNGCMNIRALFEDCSYGYIELPFNRDVFVIASINF